MWSSGVVPNVKQEHLAVLGLGYVGLPLVLALARNGFIITGFDTDEGVISALANGYDRNGEISDGSIQDTTATFTGSAADLAGCTVFIIAVPTPITGAKSPNLAPLQNACKIIAPHLTPGALVIVESTVYPGVTQDVCGPILAADSGLTLYNDIKLAYSPERVNPGDAEHSMENVIKIISAQDDETMDRVEALYTPVVKAGLHKASSIMTAEAAKVIENTQRDLNIALVNEFSLIFSCLGLDTLEVLEAAGTKWNFLPFRPGLVGGHCIGVDSYYLTYRAEQLGYHPEVILSGRRINDMMGKHISRELIKKMLAQKIDLGNAQVLILGFTFKENCADIRNTRVVDIVTELVEYSIDVDVHDPWADPEMMRRHTGITPINILENGIYDAVVVAVAHREFKEMGADAIRSLGKPGAVLYDIKGIFKKSASDLRL
ncbi:MAG: nucleotide sugar dehydrogenase [Rhodobacteraceae bacterium]|nr:nucleotide sugar dehydrogenase [Paracoccaceae bacterium]